MYEKFQFSSVIFFLHLTLSLSWLLMSENFKEEHLFRIMFFLLVVFVKSDIKIKSYPYLPFLFLYNTETFEVFIYLFTRVIQIFKTSLSSSHYLFNDPCRYYYYFFFFVI